MAFNALRDELLKDAEDVFEMPPPTLEWLKEVLDFNVPGGKLNRGLTVIHASRTLEESLGRRGGFDDEAWTEAALLGWCIELLQAFFLVADDLMDQSVTRRGQPCWYKIPKVQNIAINDSFLLESYVFRTLKKHFATKPYYTELLDLFHEVILQTEYGQQLDLTSQPQDAPQNFDCFNVDRYKLIVKYKTAFYSFYLPVACAMILNGIKDQSLFDKARDICIKIGEYFQIQDDYLDCYGTPEMIGKVGTDIQDCKCGYLAVEALDRCTQEQRKIMEDHYGKHNDKDVQAIKQLYVDLDLEQVYKTYEEKVYKELCNDIDQINGLPHQLFHDFVKKIYKRSK